MEMVTQFPGGLRVDTSFGPHVVHTDQPRGAGGDDSAPSPFQTFLASIGSCAGIYVLGFCRSRGLPTDGIRIVQSLESDEKSHLVGRIRLDIQVPAHFPEKYRPALIRAASQCAVKKHLETPPAIDVGVSAAPADRRLEGAA